jgi:hypothetical protein
MWRQAGKVSYLKYANEMGGLLRECLKEPFKEKALKASQVHFRERVFAAGGVETGKTEVEHLAAAFPISKH